MRESTPFIAAAAFLLAFAALFLLLAGCGSNIPIDPACEDLFTHQDEEAASFECERPVADCTPDFNRGYGDGFRDASDLCDLDGSYNEGYNDGVDSVVCEEPVECPEPPSCDSYGDDVPRGHLPKECRGNGPLADVTCRTVCYPHPHMPTYCETVCEDRYA